jgi:hypothetical protein
MIGSVGVSCQEYSVRVATFYGRIEDGMMVGAVPHYRVYDSRDFPSIPNGECKKKAPLQR